MWGDRNAGLDVSCVICTTSLPTVFIRKSGGEKHREIHSAGSILEMLCGFCRLGVTVETASTEITSLIAVGIKDVLE